MEQLMCLFSFKEMATYLWFVQPLSERIHFQQNKHNPVRALPNSLPCVTGEFWFETKIETPHSTSALILTTTKQEKDEETNGRI